MRTQLFFLDEKGKYWSIKIFWFDLIWFDWKVSLLGEIPSAAKNIMLDPKSKNQAEKLKMMRKKLKKIEK